MSKLLFYVPKFDAADVKWCNNCANDDVEHTEFPCVKCVHIDLGTTTRTSYFVEKE